MTVATTSYRTIRPARSKASIPFEHRSRRTGWRLALETMLYLYVFLISIPCASDAAKRDLTISGIDSAEYILARLHEELKIPVSGMRLGLGRLHRTAARLMVLNNQAGLPRPLMTGRRPCGSRAGSRHSRKRPRSMGWSRTRWV